MILFWNRHHCSGGRTESPEKLSAASICRFSADSSPEIPPSSAKDNGRKRHAEQFFRAVGRVKRRKRHVPGNKVKNRLAF